MSMFEDDDIPDLPFYTSAGVIDTEELFAYAIEQRCSDVHIKPNAPVKLRINGELLPIEGMPPLTAEEVESIVNDTQDDTQMAQFDHNRYGLNYAYEIPDVGRFRMNVLKTRYKTALVARHLIDVPPTFEDLNANPVIADLAKFHSGLILFAGETGSGKTTLMAAMIQKINSERACNIISAEDPIEIVHTDIKASVIQREVGTDVASFNDALVDALREDPDVILIGEIRNESEARAALRAAETGHLVISTIHGINSEKSITRFLEIFPHEERESTQTVLAGALRGIISQRLVRTPSGARVAANEILLNTQRMQTALYSKETGPSTYAEIVETSSEEGMQTFEQHLGELYRTGTISRGKALENATNHDKMELLLAEIDGLKAKRIEEPVVPTPPAVPFSKRSALEVEEPHRATAAPEYNLPKRPSFSLPPRA